MPTMGELISQLFNTHLKPDGEPYTPLEVCVGVRGALAPSHIMKLRSGAIPNPRRETLLALCRFFDVPPSYFFPELQGVEERPPTADLRVMLEQLSLSPDAKEQLERFLRSLQEPMASYPGRRSGRRRIRRPAPPPDEQQD